MRRRSWRHFSSFLGTLTASSARMRLMPTEMRKMRQNIVMQELGLHERLFRRDRSQPSIFSYFYSIVKRADRITRKLDASSKRKTWKNTQREMPVVPRTSKSERMKNVCHENQTCVVFTYSLPHVTRLENTDLELKRRPHWTRVPSKT